MLKNLLLMLLTFPKNPIGRIAFGLELASGIFLAIGIMSEDEVEIALSLGITVGMLISAFVLIPAWAAAEQAETRKD